MRGYLPFIVIGLTTGAVYALASMGLVLTYVTSGVFNFAHGAVGMFATYIFYSLRVDVGVPTAMAMAIAVLLVAPLLGLILDRVLFTRLYGAAPATYLVVSLGLLVALQGTATLIYGGATRLSAPLFPQSTYRLPGVNVGIDQTIVVAIAVASWIGLAMFFRHAHLGLQTRAVVGDRDLAELAGTNSRFVTTFSWMLGSAFAALSGILFAPLIGVDSVLLTLLVVQAFGAAIVGRLRSLSLTNLGAYGIAVAAAVSTKWAATQPSLIGLPSALPFLVLFFLLVTSRKGGFAEVTRHQETGRFQRVRSDRVPIRAIVGGVVVALILPAFLNSSRLLTATATLIFILIFSSLSLLVGLSRQLSLAHAVFAVLGATTLSHFLSAGLPYAVALPLAALTVIPVGALLAIPAIRLSGLFLALATFGFGVLAQYLLYPLGIVFGKTDLASVGRPSAFESDTAFYYLVLVVVVLGVLAVEIVRITRLGRILRALADSPTATESLGMNPTSSRVVVFCLSAGLAALAGGLFGSLIQSLNTASFNFFQSLIWITVLVVAGTQTMSGSVLAALLLVTMPAVVTSSSMTEWQSVAFGTAAIALAQSPNGLAGIIFCKPDFAPLGQHSAWRIGRRRALERYVDTWIGAR